MGGITEYTELWKMRKKIITSQPYIETVSGPCIQFNTTTPKLKQLQIKFSPTQSGSGTPAPDNVRPISGVSSITVRGCRKNLYDATSYPLTNNRWVSGTTGEVNTATANEYAATLDFIPCAHIAGKVITLNKRPGGNNPGISFYTDTNEASFISGAKDNNGTAGTQIKYGIPLEAKYMRFTTVYNATDVQLELGTEATTYEPYEGKSFTINLGDTYYGGYVDLVNGTFVQENACATLNGGVGTFYTMSDRIRFAIVDSRMPGLDYGSGENGEVKISGVMASNMPVVANGTSDSTTLLPSICMGWSGPAAYVALPTSYGVTNTDGAKTWIQNNPIQYVYKLRTPNTIQLSSQVLTALRGVQTFFTENDYITLQYWTNTSDNYNYEYDGIPVLIDNARFNYSNGGLSNITADNDFFITSLFDTGSSNSKSYTMSRTTTSSSGTNSCARLYDSLNATSVDYWANNSANIATNPYRTFSSKGRYIASSLRKSEAKNMYLYRVIDGINTYLFKGNNVS